VKQISGHDTSRRNWSRAYWMPRADVMKLSMCWNKEIIAQNPGEHRVIPRKNPEDLERIFGRVMKTHVFQKNTWIWGGNTWKEYRTLCLVLTQWQKDCPFPLANLDKLIIHITVDRKIRTYLPQQWEMNPRLTNAVKHQKNYKNKPKMIKIFINIWTIYQDKNQKKKLRNERYI
jgi:hypothetical protein